MGLWVLCAPMDHSARDGCLRFVHLQHLRESHLRAHQRREMSASTCACKETVAVDEFAVAGSAGGASLMVMSMRRSDGGGGGGDDDDDECVSVCVCVRACMCV